MNKSNHKIRELNATKSLTDLSTKISFQKHLQGWPSVLSLKRGGNYRILIFQVTEHISASFSRIKTQTVSVPGLVTTHVIIICSLDLLPAPLAWPTTCQRIWIMRTQGNAIKVPLCNSSGGLHRLYQVAAWSHKYEVWRLLGIWFYKCYQFSRGTFNQTAGT